MPANDRPAGDKEVMACPLVSGWARGRVHRGRAVQPPWAPTMTLLRSATLGTFVTSAFSTASVPAHVTTVYDALSSECNMALRSSSMRARRVLQGVKTKRPFVDFGIAGSSAQVATYVNVTRTVSLRATGQHVLVCEVGFNCGHSSVAFLEADRRVHVLNFDLPTAPWSVAGRNFMRARYGSRFRVIDGPSSTTIPRFMRKHPEAAKCDLIVVDGGHAYSQVVADLVHMMHLAHCNAFVLLDDVCDPLKCHAHVMHSFDHMHAGQNHPTVVGPTQAWTEAKARGAVVEVRAWMGAAQDRGWVLGSVICDASTGQPINMSSFPRTSGLKIRYSPDVPFSGGWGTKLQRPAEHQRVR